MDDHQSRSSTTPAAAQDDHQGTFEAGVGGRQANPLSPPVGGGYQDNRTILNFRAGDLRIDDLRKIGLPHRHLRLVEVIGVEAYIALWRFVGTDDDFLNRHGYAELKMRPFRSFLRYKRNMYIKALAVAGLSAKVIRQHVQRDLCESLSKRHVLRVMTKK